MVDLEKFMEWLNDEKEKYENGSEENSYRLSQTIRIQSKLCEMSVHDKYTEDQIGAFCKRYCKFFEAYGDREEDRKRMITERCFDCPIERLAK